MGGETIRVRQGKGHKDRQVMLSPKLLEVRADLLEKLPTQGLALFRGVIGAAGQQRDGLESLPAGRKGGPSVETHITAHTLRQCFATHLLGGD